MMIRSTAQAKRSTGRLGMKFLRDARLTFWTLSAWDNDAAMRAFMTSGAHRRAMPKLLDWCDEASVAHWNQDTPELPDWKAAHRRMVKDGRLSKVRHPSTDHLAGNIAEPRLQ